MATVKKIVISGYYGFDNTGDEAVLYSILQALGKECKGMNLHITVLSNQPEKTSARYGVSAINRWDMKKVYAAVKECGLLITGGGSLLQDVTSNKTIPYYLAIIQMARWHKKEVVFYSQGYGPVNKKHNQYLIKKVLNKVKYIFVRDTNSKQNLEDIGVIKQPISVVADPVLGMIIDESIEHRMKEYVDTYSQGKVRIGIYLRSWKNDNELIEKMKAVCEALDEDEVDLFFIPMQQPEDSSFLKQFDFPQDYVYQLTDELDVAEVFALTGQMDMVLGMRLHALIMATAQGIPTVGLSYDPKVDDFMKMINNPYCFGVENFKVEDIVSSIRKQLDAKEEDILMNRQRLMDKVYEPAKLINNILT